MMSGDTSNTECRPGDPETMVPKSANDILASVHLKERLVERNISEAEFDAAIKYGERTEGDVLDDGRKRWKISYKGITIITDYDMKVGITSWANPCFGFDLQKVPITDDLRKKNNEALAKMNEHDSWNSHAVIIIDQSGSMRKTDTTKGATRSDLVWLCLAVDYIGKRIVSGEASSMDFMSIVELGGSDRCILKHQPIDWILYNKVIDYLRSRLPKGPGRYIPAIDTAQQLLSINKSGKCALQLVFLTDGVPSDYGGQGLCKYEACNRIASLACRFGSRLTVGGFAVGSGELLVLEAMVKTAKEYNCRGFLMEASLRVEDLSSAFRSMSTFITKTKTTMTDFRTGKQRTYRDLIREPKSAIEVYIPSEESWKKFMNDASKLRVRRTYFDKYEYCWVYPEKVFEHRNAVGIAVRDYIFGEGKERAVRRVREVNRLGHFVGRPLVGKETLFKEDLKEKNAIAFHKNFCKVQQLASRFARKFNNILFSLPGIDDMRVPTIEFLNCWVMMYDDGDERKGLLVEKMLDHAKYKKWNSNAGYVRNKTSDLECKPPFRFKEPDISFTIQDIPQAFSHYTYLASRRKFLVCDLQGVLDEKSYYPKFELTDPAIHYKKKTTRIDFGRTDRGEEGIQDFLNNHTCSDLCRFVSRRWIVDPMEKNIVICRDVLSSNLQARNEENTDGVADIGPAVKKEKKRVRFNI
mmetsp:Transcript_8703/g.18025  ORF Transcript_8703/g.18025 Transcript_8703/m.18025 type:complete len:695 (+) Transcript_8703:188-2272(+)